RRVIGFASFYRGLKGWAAGGASGGPGEIRGRAPPAALGAAAVGSSGPGGARRASVGGLRNRMGGVARQGRFGERRRAGPAADRFPRRGLIIGKLWEFSQIGVRSARRGARERLGYNRRFRRGDDPTGEEKWAKAFCCGWSACRSR